MGEVFCWGENSSGQLGNGTVNSQTMPVLMDGGSILKNREVFAIAVNSTLTMVAHRELTTDRAKTFSDLKTQIQKQVAEEERLQALAEAEAKARAEAEARARADLARRTEVSSIRENLTQRVQNLSQNILASQAKCEASTRNLTAQQRLAIARTSISTSCDKYTLTANSLGRDLASVDVENVTEANYASKISSLNSFTKQLQAIEETYYIYFADIARVGSDFEKLIYLEEVYAQSAVKDYRNWIALESRIQKLPAVTKKSITEKSNYRGAMSKAISVEAAQRSFETYRSSLMAITSTRELSVATTQLATIIAKLDSAETLYLDIAAIEKLIPASVCTKGGSVTPVPKNGKCLAGAKKTPTRQTAFP